MKWKIQEALPFAFSREDGRPIGECYGKTAAISNAQLIVTFHTLCIDLAENIYDEEIIARIIQTVGSVVQTVGRGQQWRRVVRGADIDGNSITMIVTVVYHFRRIVVLEIEGERDEE